MKYQYIVTDQSGNVERGVLEAASPEKVASHLHEQNYYIIAIHPYEKKIAQATRSLAGSIRGRISLLDKVIFSRHLSIMLSSGLSLAESLAIIQEQSASKKLSRIVGDIQQQVNNGKSLADSLVRYPKVFGGIIIGMVRVGEASGTLEQNLEYIATVLEKDYELRRKVKAAMIYPAIVLSATVILGIGLSVFILPKLVRMFSTFRIELPLTTQIFLNLANFLVNYGLYLLAALVAIGVGLRFFARTQAGKRFFHRLYLRLPVIKKVSKSLNLSRCSRVLAILLQSGVTINESLQITKQVVDNVVYKQVIRQANEAVQKGGTVAVAFNDQRYVPKMAQRMIGVGEKTGNLDKSFAHLADFYEDELNTTTKNLATLLEPVLLVVIGIILGFLAVAIISPIYQFTGSLRR